jgi:hypothetical protein
LSRLVFFALTAVLSLAQCFSLSAQSAAAPDLLPEAEALGEGWSRLSGGLEDAGGSQTFNSLSGTTYGGPNGSRAFVVVTIVAEGPAATRESWEFGGTAFEEFRLTFDADYSSERDLEDVPNVQGCADMRRMNGVDKVIPTLLVGVSLCAADPDKLVLAYVSGEVNGKSGIDASDSIVDLVLNATPASTPPA